MSTEKTISSWPKAIHSAKDLPEIYMSNFEKVEYKRFPYSILIPKEVKGKENLSESVISLLEDGIMVSSKEENGALSKVFKFDEILYIEFGVILLYSWINIYGFVDGKVETANLVFNSVQEDLFSPMILAIRKNKVFLVGEEVNGLSKIDYLLKLNMKLYNYTKRCLIPGETILHSIYQPQIKESLFKLFNRIKSETSVTVLTNNEMIVVHEPEKIHHTDEHKGVVWQYINLKSIKEIYIKDSDHETLKLVLKLKDGTLLEFLYSLLNLKDLEELKAKVKEIKR